MYEKLIAELWQHHCDAREDDTTQEVCEECAYDVIIADKSVPSGIASVCVCGLMHRAADAIEELTAADVRPVVQRDEVMQALNKYFSIGDSYTYELNRVKEAFYVGTMTFDDFEEWNEDNVSDLCDYLMKELFDPNCGARMEES